MDRYGNSYDSKPFLSEDYTFGLSRINMSVGAIYLSILDLPRHLRYKQEFILLAGILPGPSEPKNIKQSSRATC